ncbi:hypothetical protein MVLG_05125 [Microbotryum lychnidis-dioicae p1A1 Lamole]|uniref:Uncharacterized protein n=1 Tax=Microbotryum lychnidis-dioicae (strain p1A1 Lamole / MvSl-1064) TaxID=683840 RepID=U5HDA9_USTV1|nr:hypothetical protein MVLG_05125 [Microbotryum lychnidis-dioicae p1A1 Lamole]|eukprot:KDE04410.1 hypothetical protein MVLG_05125 [Microbotryum lychnidis-dioicae p1A1 Lamole]
MKTFFLRSSLLALATCALGASAIVTNPSEQHEPLDLDKRTFGLIPLSPCGIFKGGMSGISTYSSLSLNLGLTARVRCPLTFRCDGSGTDGHLYDINGLPVPSCFPSTWRYFGIERGWQPPASFSCGSSWTVPTAWCPSVHLAPWFRPGPGVALSYSSGLNIPSWWLPSAGWSCSGNLGIGGYAFDPYGQGPPIGASGFLYFGLGRGWLPPAGLRIDVNFIFPSGCGDLHLATWWSPPIEWVPPPKFGCPIWWKCKRCQSPTTSVTLSLPAPTTTTSAATIAQTTAAQSPTTSAAVTTAAQTTSSAAVITTSARAPTSDCHTTTTAQATTAATTTEAQAPTTASTTTAQVTTSSSTSASTTNLQTTSTAAATTSSTASSATGTSSSTSTSRPLQPPTTAPSPPCTQSTTRTHHHHHSVPTTRRIITSTVQLLTSTSSASRPTSTSVSTSTAIATSTSTRSSCAGVPTTKPHHKHPQHGKGKGKCNCALQDPDDEESD